MRVINGFRPDYMPNGYRDIKLNVALGGHICEIQMHIKAFRDLTPGQHEVYEWARKLNVTVGMDATDLIHDMSPETKRAMVVLARANWCGTNAILPFLLADSMEWDEARSELTEVRTN